MPRQVIPLTDTKLKALQPTNKPQTFFDGGGLFILVNANGSKWWRYKYTFGGKTKTLSFGTYPDVSLKEAREKREQANKLRANGTDPSEDRKEKKRITTATATTFEQIFRDWLDVQSAKLSLGTVTKIRSSMENHALPRLGQLPIAEIRVDQVLAILRVIEEKQFLEMASRIRAWCSQVFRYAIVIGECDRNPAADLRGVLRVPKVVHHAALPASQLPAFLTALEDPLARLAPLTRLALHLLILTATRPGELRGAEWSEFDLENNEWHITPERMKMKEPHVVPLTPQAKAVLKKIQLFSGEEKYLFPAQGNRTRTLSENTLGKAAKCLGFSVTAHGFRATFSTYANESEKWSDDAIEAQLAHKPTDAVRNAYYRGNRKMDERRRLMQWWSDELDQMRGRGKIIENCDRLV